MGTNTGIGIGIGIPFKNNALGGDRPYLPPELKARLIGVWDNYGKKNTDADRNIIKNKIPNAGGDLEILNAAYKLNSGFGEYKEDFTSWRIYPNIEVTDNVITTNGNFNLTWFIYKHSSESKINEMNIKVSGIPKGGKILYFYISDETANLPIAYTIPKDGIYHLPESKINNNRVSVGFTVESRYDWNNIRIEQIPSFEGAFVTDGIDDLITSTKTVQEMGITGEITVVSMIHKISSDNNWTNLIGELKGDHTFVANRGINTDKTGIYGYTYNYNKNAIVINNILGDKNDYIVKTSTSLGLDNKYYVTGFRSAGIIQNISQIAWYWTIIANKVLTTDQINQVIAYFNLDRTLKSDIYCNIAKQGITNENHAEFGDKLIDFSGNGRDIQLNNIAWDGDSGIGKYNYPNWKVTATIANTYSTIVNYPTVNGTYSINVNGVSELMQSIGLHLEIKYTTSTGIIYNDIKQDGVYSYILPDGATDLTLRFGGIPGIVNEPCNITITQIPSHAGALYLDGVSDFGQFVGDLGLKDYTFIADRAYDRIVLEQAPFIASKSTNGQAPFLMEYLNSDNYVYPHSFGATTKTTNLNIQRQISYQSTYVYNGNSISKGTSVDTGDGLTIGNSGSTGAQYSPLCLWSLMLFPYSMSEFLIERQLKKHKLGTLYPNMVEFRPVIKANANYKITYYQIDSTNTWKSIKVGDYIVIGAKLAFQITFDNDASELKEVVSPQLSGIIVEKRPSNPGYNIYSYITSKSPQKINITIDEYIRFEDIVQPYPSLFTLIDYDTEEVYSWGSKLKVGARFKGNVVNLLPNMYEWQGNVLYNGEVLDWGIKPGVVAKEMVFSWNMPFKYLIDNNEPKCILSPRLLRIPNSSYKILGYIPDISGHGNNGVIHNSAYAEGSGVNEDGSYQFDGVDDFVTIPTIVGGKQVLMKVNWQNKTGLLYDQRKNGSSIDAFAILNVNSNNSIAYNSRNTDGETYIDGILNKNIVCPQLYKITHSITIINQLANKEEVISPTIGSDTTHKVYFSQMSLYDFMLFDNISTDDKIKELNEYVGIEAKVELPPYYWDTYGKTNSDADRDTIQQRGVAVGDYDLTNYNHAYDKMSGYGGYEFAKFDNTEEWKLSSTSDTMELLSTNGYSFTARRLEGQTWWKYKNKVTTDVGKNLTVKVRTNNSVRINWELKYRTAEKPDADSTLGLLSTLLTPNVVNDIILPVKTQEELDSLGAISHFYIIYFPPIDVRIGDEYTVEMLPLYPNGLVYDGITDYSENANIPALDDFTAIIKREWLKNQGCPLIKGSKVYEGGNGNALLLEWDKAYNFVFYKRTDIMEGEVPDNISFITPTNYNGNVITRGSEQDTNGICIAGDGNAGFANMVFYKLILYPKTIPLLQINFLKNLMEKDEIIDLNNPIFIKNE